MGLQVRRRVRQQRRLLPNLVQSLCSFLREEKGKTDVKSASALLQVPALIRRGEICVPFTDRGLSHSHQISLPSRCNPQARSPRGDVIYGICLGRPPPDNQSQNCCAEWAEPGPEHSGRILASKTGAGQHVRQHSCPTAFNKGSQKMSPLGGWSLRGPHSSRRDFRQPLRTKHPDEMRTVLPQCSPAKQAGRRVNPVHQTSNVNIA